MWSKGSEKYSKGPELIRLGLTISANLKLFIILRVYHNFIVRENMYKILTMHLLLP